MVLSTLAKYLCACCQLQSQSSQPCCCMSQCCCCPSKVSCTVGLEATMPRSCQPSCQVNCIASDQSDTCITNGQMQTALHQAPTWSTDTTLPVWLYQYDSGLRILTCTARLATTKLISALSCRALPSSRSICYAGHCSAAGRSCFLRPTWEPRLGPTSFLGAALGAAAASAPSARTTSLAARWGLAASNNSSRSVPCSRTRACPALKACPNA